MSVASTLEEMVLELMVKGAIDQKVLAPRLSNLKRDLESRSDLTGKLDEIAALIRGGGENAKQSYTLVLTLLEDVRRATSTDDVDSLDAIPTSVTYDRDVEPAVLASMEQELTEKCAAMEHDLLLLERSPDSADTVLEIMGHLHSIKGIAGFMELTAVMKLAHVTESALIVHGDGLVHGNVSSTLFRVVDMIRTMVSQVVEHHHKGGRRALRLPPTFNLLFKDLLKLHDLGVEPEDAAATTAQTAPSPALATTMMDESLDESVSLPRRQYTPQADDELYEEFTSALTIDDGAEDIFGNLVEDDEVTDTASTPAPARETTQKQLVDLGGQVRVPMSRLDELGEIVSETVIAFTQLATDPAIQAQITMDIERKLSRVSNALRSLQGTSMNLRLFPFSTVLTPLRRAARDLADKQGKSIRFTCVGEETELDKGVLQDLSDPLLHLIRNAIDHGVETTEERKAAGKPESGTLALQVESRRGKVVVTVTDDGRGLDRERILSKAKANGLISQSANPTDAEVWELIFRAGFSTAETISEISGRGVGMDVVKRRVERLSGTVAVESEAGTYTRFSLTLPLTLAMFDGLLLKVGKQTYIVPQATVSEVIRPRASQVDTVHQKGVMLSLRDQTMPLVRLQDYVGTPGEKQHPCDGTVLVSHNPEATYGLMVDAVLGRQPVVLRNISEALPNYHGVSGCAILGDGSLGLVLDMDEIYSHVNLHGMSLTPATAS